MMSGIQSITNTDCGVAFVAQDPRMSFGRHTTLTCNLYPVCAYPPSSVSSERGNISARIAYTREGADGVCNYNINH